MNSIKRLEKSFDFWFLVFVSFFFFLLRLPSIFEPYWYGDEGIYQVIGVALRHGSILYQGIWDNKPPLLYVIYGIFNSEQDLVRAASLVFGILAMVAFYIFAKKLFTQKIHLRAVYIATALFALLLGAPTLEGNIANAENFMLFPIISAGIISLMAFEKKSAAATSRLFLISGVLLGISFLFKIVAIFDFAAFLTFFLILRTQDLNKLLSKKFIIENIKYFAPYIGGFLIPLALVVLYFISQGAFPLFFKATFLSNVGYVAYGNTFFIPQGLLFLKIAVLGTLLLLIYLKRNSLPHHLILILVWLSFSIFNAFFSQRPYTHYLLVLVPSFSLLLGAIIYDVKQRGMLVLYLFVTLLIVSLNFSFGGKSVAYYRNFVDFLSDKKNLEDYRSFFDKKTPIDYQVADFLLTNTTDKDGVFIWGNNAQLYKLINKIPPGRYIVAYHITSYADGLENTDYNLSKNPPKYIVVMPNVPSFPFSLSRYSERIRIGNIIIYEKSI